MTDEVHEADECDDQIPVFSSLGDDSYRSINVTSGVGADQDTTIPIVSPIGHVDEINTYSQLGDGSECAIEVHSPIGVEALTQLPTFSTLGKGPKGDTGEQGEPGVVDEALLETTVSAELDARIVLVPYVDWPPADPQDGILYLRAALES